MAYGIRQIPIADLKPSMALGVAIPFQADNVFTSVYTTQEQTKYNIINFMLTDRRERPFNPNFGAGLRSRLFEQITQDDLDSLKQTISNQVEAYFPNVQMNSIQIIGDPDTATITISMAYTLKNLRTSDTLLLRLQNT